jgi:hypothetical protein
MNIFPVEIIVHIMKRMPRDSDLLYIQIMEEYENQGALPPLTRVASFMQTCKRMKEIYDEHFCFNIGFTFKKLTFEFPKEGIKSHSIKTEVNDETWTDHYFTFCFKSNFGNCEEMLDWLRDDTKLRSEVIDAVRIPNRHSDVILGPVTTYSRFELRIFNLYLHEGVGYEYEGLGYLQCGK